MVGFALSCVITAHPHTLRSSFFLAEGISPATHVVEVAVRLTLRHATPSCVAI